eukprot:1761648-Pyramimonas_sp.AAC.1
MDSRNVVWLQTLCKSLIRACATVMTRAWEEFEKRSEEGEASSLFKEVAEQQRAFVDSVTSEVVHKFVVKACFRDKSWFSVFEKVLKALLGVRLPLQGDVSDIGALKLVELGMAAARRLAISAAALKVSFAGELERDPVPVSYTHLTLPTILLV